MFLWLHFRHLELRRHSAAHLRMCQYVDIFDSQPQPDETTRINLPQSKNHPYNGLGRQSKTGNKLIVSIKRSTTPNKNEMLRKDIRKFTKVQP